MNFFLLAVCTLLAFPQYGAGQITVDIDLLSLLKPKEVRIETLEGDTSFAFFREDVTFPNSVLHLHTGEQLTISVDEREKNEILSSRYRPPYMGTMRMRIDGEAGVNAGRIESILIGPAVMKLTVPGHKEFSRRVRTLLSISTFKEPSVLRIIAKVPLEQAVAEITAAEIGGRGVPEQALMAQAVCVRSYLLWKQREGRYVFFDTSRDGAYRGIDGAFGPDGALSIEQGDTAASESAGLILVDHTGRAAPGYYNACCGGVSLTPEQAFSVSPAGVGFSSRERVFCAGSPDFRWSWRVGKSELQERVLKPIAGGMPRLDVERSNGTNSIMIVYEEPKSDLVFARDTFRIAVGRVFGWDALRSNAFSIEGKYGVLIFSGSGKGHNVGLCQAGAIEMARQGRNWREIIEFYFPGAAVRSLAEVQGGR